MTTRRFTTSTGIVKRTGTTRRFVVVDNRNGSIIYRTDVRDRAEARKRKALHFEVVDLDAG